MIITPKINLSLIAKTALGATNTQLPLLYYLDDNSALYFASTSYAGKLLIYAIDKSGALTQWVYYTPSYCRSIIPLGAGFFFVGLGNGDNFIQQFYNAKLNNGIPLVIRKNVAISNPCYSGSPQYFFDRVKNILAAGFYDPSGQYGGPVYASFYTPTTRGLIPIQSGFVGYYSDAPVFDPFNKTAVNIPAGYVSQTFSGVQSNSISQSLYSVAGSYAIVAANYSVNMGSPSDCVTPSGANVSLVSSYNNITIGPAYANTASAFDSNMPGLTGCNVYTSEYNLQIFYNSTPAYLVPHNLGANCNFVLTKTGNLFACDEGQFNFPNNGIYLGTFNEPLSFNAFSSRASFLINAHRPVSIFGSYKA